MSRLLVDDVTKTDARALLNVNKMATISDIVAPSNEYIYASGANELTVVEGCVIAVGGAGIFKTANTILTAANLDAGSAFTVGKDYYVYICDSRIDSADEKYVISLNSTYPTGWNATNSRKIGGFHYGRCRKVDSNLQPLNGSSVIFGTGWESAVSNGIVPRSVWTLGHRPKCSPEGMVYLGGGTWVDIYLNSDDGAKGLKSEYGCAPMTGTESMNWYIRYMDDFVILSPDKEQLRNWLARIEQFLREELKLEFNPKTTMLAAKNGIDFVGYKHRATHRKVRKDSIKRIKRTIKKCESGKITKEQLQKSIQSWTGHAGHADSYNLRKKIETLAEAAIEKAA